MSLNAPSTAGAASLVGRARALLLTPSAAWNCIDGETATIGGLFGGYVLPLATIPALASVVHGLWFSRRSISTESLILWAVLNFALSLAMTYLLALIIDGLAPHFGGCRNRIQAFKVAAYTGTAGWIAGMFAALPILGLLAALGALYSLYLLYRGLPKLMKAPPERAVAYTALTVGVTLAFGVLVAFALGSVGAVIGSVAGIENQPFNPAPSPTPGVASFSGADAERLNAAAKQAQLAADQIHAAQRGDADAIKAVAPDRLKAFLPESLPGYPRASISAQSQTAMGVQGTRAIAIYKAQGGHISLRISDLAAASALANVALAFDVEKSKETATGYQKVGKVDGRLTFEQFDRRAQRGKYSVLVAGRFLIEVEGAGAGIDQLKAAAADVGYDKLESVAHGG